MVVKANIQDLELLYNELKESMTFADKIVSDVDAKFTQARQEWVSKGATQFEEGWTNTFKPTLTKMVQAFAAAGSDVAQQHNDMARGAQEAGDHPVLQPVTSPR